MPRTRRPHRPARPGALALPALLLLGGTLVACGSAEEPDPVNRELMTLSPDPSQTPDEPSGDPTPTDDGSPTEEPAGEGTESPAGSGGAASPAVAAVEAARDAVPRGTPVELDRTGGGWEVTLVRPGGAEVRVQVGGGSTPVVRGSDDDADDRRDNLRRIVDLQVGIERAITLARGINGSSPLDSVELELDDGLLEWEVDFDDGPDVVVDGRTGAARPD